MRALLIEDNKAVSDAVSAVLQKYELDVSLVETVAEALDEYRSRVFDTVILDTAVDGNRGLDFVTSLIMSSAAPAPRIRTKAVRSPGIVVIRRPEETVPRDSIEVKSVIGFPFSEKDLVGAIRDSMNDTDQEVAGGFSHKEDDAASPESLLKSYGVVEGGAYISFNAGNGDFKAVTSALSNIGRDIMLVSPSRIKIAKEHAGIERFVEFRLLNGSRYPMGTIVSDIQSYAEVHDMPVVALDDLDSVIDHCGLDRTLAVLSFLKSVIARKPFTFITVVDGSTIRPGVREIMGNLMNIF